MRRLLAASIASCGVFLFVSLGMARAQATNYARPYPGPGSVPALSPYLNLVRPGNPAVNYYLGVLPEIERRVADVQFGAAIQDLQRQVGTLQGLEYEDLLTGLPPTGHGAVFNSYGTYFNTGIYPRGQVGLGGRRPR
jgi:hypothetical protein